MVGKDPHKQAEGRGGVGLWFGATPELRLWGSPEAEVWEPFQPPVMPEAALEKQSPLLCCLGAPHVFPLTLLVWALPYREGRLSWGHGGNRAVG